MIDTQIHRDVFESMLTSFTVDTVGRNLCRALPGVIGDDKSNANESAIAMGHTYAIARDGRASHALREDKRGARPVAVTLGVDRGTGTAARIEVL